MWLMETAFVLFVRYWITYSGPGFEPCLTSLVSDVFNGTTYFKYYASDLGFHLVSY
jgi:hypothetical protein